MKKPIAVVVFLATFSICKAQSPQTPQSQSQPAVPNTDIFLADLSLHNGHPIVGKPSNATHRSGYDNQPFFLPDRSEILFTVIGEADQADIYKYNYKTGQRTQFTQTKESEYSPTVTPDGKFISVVRVENDKTQRLWKFPISAGKPTLVLENVQPIGYHVWIDSNTVVAFVLGSEGQPDTLQMVNLRTGSLAMLAKNIGRCLQRVPGERQISYIQKINENESMIRAYDPAKKTSTDLIKTLPGSKDYAWSPDGLLLMAEGSTLYFADPAKKKDWTEIKDLGAYGLKSITRIAINPAGNKIAIVSETE